jgi:hypothetical protein
MVASSQAAGVGYLAATFSFSQWQTRVTAGIGGALAIVVGWGIGLFELKSAPPTPVLSTNKPIVTGEWVLRLERASADDRLPDGSTVMAGRKAIVLHLQATNRTGETSSSYLQAIKVETAVRGIDANPIAYLQRDNTITTDLQPALPEELALVWTYPATTKVPARLHFTVNKRTYKAFDNLYAQPGWFDSGKVGVIDLPIAAANPDVTGAAS